MIKYLKVILIRIIYKILIRTFETEEEKRKFEIEMLTPGVEYLLKYKNKELKFVDFEISEISREKIFRGGEYHFVMQKYLEGLQKGDKCIII